MPILLAEKGNQTNEQRPLLRLNEKEELAFITSLHEAIFINDQAVF